ncbi:alkaline phosphatase [Bacterioplanes sanyensis]|uniref:Alkaline phosphatase n=1 Tax=Bacterioplanes sanyensis TaxID=1249553 RepID=A0A222FJU8_9GAMM|nr:alkaline phosphatase [Bacterioplanes sanyensis]ASP39019.1 alkaline phosphatase [Bacterioplanes sanyensis]
MNKRINATLAALAWLWACGASALLAEPSYQQGQQWLQQRLAHTPSSKPAKNVIFFLGDGMSITTLTAGRIFQGQQQGGSGEEHFLAFERFAHSALIQTYNSNQQTPDSAGTMTALMTGVKTRAGAIAIGPEQLRGVCQGSEQHHLTTLLQWAQQQGYATGVVTNARLTHATPASTYAHSPERKWEGPDDLPEEAQQQGCRDIASQLIQTAFPAGLDLALGGGRSKFPQTLLQQFDGEFVDAREQLLNLPVAGETPVLGLFGNSHLAYAYDREQYAAMAEEQPTLPEMTRFAIERLQHLSRASEQGFILIVEGARIDHAHHLGNAFRALTETTVLADSVAMAQQLSSDDTLLIVTADHSHTLSMAGYPQRGNPILGMVKQYDAQGQTQLVMAADQQPYTTLGYANGPGAVDMSVPYDPASGQLPPRIAGRQQWWHNGKLHTHPQHANFCQEALLPLKSETHGSDDVALHASGPGAELFHGLLEQHAVYHLIRRALAMPTQPQEF